MRQGNKLTARKVASLAGHQEKELVGDGHGLYLKDGRSWLFRYMFRGRVGNMGLGPLHAVNLAEARTRARQAHQLILDGKDPLAIKQEAVMMRMAEAAKVVTFDQCATDYIASHAAAWKNAKHRDQWRSTLDTYASPVFGKLAVSMIDLPLVLKVLDPIWTEKPETASRLRGRIERILAWATVKGFRQGDNPARWQGNLDSILPAKAKVRAVKHHEAMAYAEVGTFMAKLRGKESLSAKALNSPS